jgi:hypothetical protein
MEGQLHLRNEPKGWRVQMRQEQILMSSSGLGRGRDKAGDVGVGEERLMGAYQCLLLDADLFIKQHTHVWEIVYKKALHLHH